MLTLGMLAAMAPALPIDFVGASTGSNDTTNATQTKPLTNLTGGSRAAVLPGDIVFLICADAGTVVTDITVSSPGWNEMTALYANDATRDSNLHMFWKIMGDPADTEVVFKRTTGTVSDGNWIIYAISGVDPTMPFDVNPTTSTGTDGGQPNPPAVTPVNEGSKVLAVGSASGGAAASTPFTAADLNHFATLKVVSAIAGAGLKDWVSGVSDPATFGGGSTSTSDSWCARTIALRPKGAVSLSAPVNTTAPAISGNAYAGGVVTCSTGNWSGNPAPTFGFQWKLDGVNIGGATAQSYTCLAGDVGKTLTCTVTATNTQGNASSTTAGTVVGSIAKPTIIGTATRSGATTFSHEVVAGTDCLIVRSLVGAENPSSVPSTCSWNGVAMTKGASCYGSNNNNGANAVIFYLLNPTPGTGNVVINSSGDDIASAENWSNVSGIGANKASSASSQLSSFSFSFTKTNELNVLISAGVLRQGTGWTPGTNNIEEYDAVLGSISHRAYFGRAETGSTAAASCGGGTNTFGACALELVAG